jgi:membrane-associated phospholipid phosphatase
MLVAMMIGLVALLYYPASLATADRSYDLMTDLDRAIPFVPWTWWIYFPHYVFGLAVTTVALPDPRIVFRVFLAIILAQGISSVLYFVLPSTFPRPLSVGDADPLTAAALNWFWGIDPANNTFPSTHVAIASLAAMAAWVSRHPVKWYSLLVAIGVVVTIHTAKQHYWIDAVGGIMVAVVAFRLALRLWPIRSHLAVILAVGLLAGCVYVQEPAAPEVVVNVTGGGGGNTCSNCDADAMKGRVYRLTQLEIDEPEAFASILNLIWQSDIRNNILNVLVVVDEVVAGRAGNAFDKVSVTLGPGWRRPKMPYVLPAQDGSPAFDMVDDYCLLQDLSLKTDLMAYHGTLCQLKSANPTSLYFHSGPRDGPLICAPDNGPPNNIPISNMSIRVAFNDDCTELVDGFLLGCITMEAADRICMCMGAPGACSMDPRPGSVYEPGVLDEACHSACSPDWLSFGNIIRSFELAPGCLTPDGTSGYFVQAFFSGVLIPPEKFNPVSSNDCSLD